MHDYYLFILFSDHVSEGLVLENGNAGPWAEANDFILDAELAINGFLNVAKGYFFIEPVDFSTNETTTLNNDFEQLFHYLDSIGEEHRQLVDHIKTACVEYIDHVMHPRLIRLEMIILLNAFNFRGKPMVDLFYKYNDKARVMKSPDEFSYIMAGGFMSLFYKVSYKLNTHTSF